MPLADHVGVVSQELELVGERGPVDREAGGLQRLQRSLLSA